MEEKELSKNAAQQFAADPVAASQETELRFDIKYRISLEDYLSFNFLLSDQTIDKRRKRSMIMGCVEIVFAVIFFASLVSQPTSTPNYWLFMALDALVLLFGLYTVLFYKVLFPKQLTKSATKQYQKNDYLQNEINVRLYDDKVVEVSGEYENEVPWQDILEFKVSKTLLLIMLDQSRCILVPKSQIQGQVKAVREFLNGVCERYEKRILRAEEKTKPEKGKTK